MELKQKLEALLFVTDRPLSMDELVEYSESTALEISAALEELRQECAVGRGIQLIRIAGGWQLSTKPELAPLIADFLQPKRHRLSKAQLEVLAIVAYQQPITMGEIDAIRGVQSDHSLRGLVDKRLVHEVGKKQAPGRPILYGTTPEFLHAFGLDGVHELPSLEVAVHSSLPS